MARRGWCDRWRSYSVAARNDVCASRVSLHNRVRLIAIHDTYGRQVSCDTSTTRRKTSENILTGAVDRRARDIFTDHSRPRGKKPNGMRYPPHRPSRAPQRDRCDRRASGDRRRHRCRRKNNTRHQKWQNFWRKKKNREKRLTRKPYTDHRGVGLCTPKCTRVVFIEITPRGVGHVAIQNKVILRCHDQRRRRKVHENPFYAPPLG